MPIIGLVDQIHLAEKHLRLRQSHPFLLENPASPLPNSVAVDFARPETIVQWAYWGEMLCYPSVEEFKSAVKKGSPYEREANQRLARYRRDISNINIDLKKCKAAPIRENAIPDVRELSNAIGTCRAHDAALMVEQIIADTAFLKSESSNQRMDLRAKDLGFEAGFPEYQRYLLAVDKHAKDCGFGCFRNLCVPTAYINHLRKTRPELSELLNSEQWKADEVVYEKSSPYVLDRIIFSETKPEEAKVKFVVRSGFLYYIFGPGEHDWDALLSTFERGALPELSERKQAEKLALLVQEDVRRNGPPNAAESVMPNQSRRVR